MELFAKATRLKLRFKSEKGLINAEDLWDLTLEKLDPIAIALNTAKEASSVSFVKRKTSSNATAELSFEVVKYVIDTKLAEEEAALVAKEKRQKKMKLMDLIARKEEDALSATSLEDLKKQLLEVDA